MGSSREHNQSYISNLNEDKITSLLLEGFAGYGLSGFASLQLTNEPSVPIQLQYLFEELNPKKQELFKNGTVRAIQEWTFEAHGTEALINLAYLAAYIRASRAIKHFRCYLEGPELKALDHEEYLDTVSSIIAVLQGFAPSDEVKELFERLLCKNQFKEFAAQLFLGLCKCQPSEYPKHLQRFLDINKENPDSFRLDFIIRKFERTVALKTIADNLDKLDRSYIVDFVDLLCYRDWSPLTLNTTRDPQTHCFSLVSKKGGDPLQKLSADISDYLSTSPEFRKIIEKSNKIILEKELNKKNLENEFAEIRKSNGSVAHIDKALLGVLENVRARLKYCKLTDSMEIMGNAFT